MSTQKNAKLRVCASCQWIFSTDTPNQTPECPKCMFGSYGARFVYGDKAYTYQHTQEPWLKDKVFDYRMKLYKEIKETNESVSPRKNKLI